MQQNIDEILQYVRDHDDTLLGKRFEFKGQVMSVEEYLTKVFVNYSAKIEDYIEYFQRITYDYEKKQIYSTVLADKKYHEPINGNKFSFIDYLESKPGIVVSTIGIVDGDEIIPFDEEFELYSLPMDEPSLEETEKANKKHFIGVALKTYMELENIPDSKLFDDEEFHDYINGTFMDFIIERVDVYSAQKDNSLVGIVGELFEKALAQVEEMKKTKTTEITMSDPGEEEIEQLPNDGDPEVEATMKLQEEPIVAQDNRTDVEKIEEFEIVGNMVSTESVGYPTERELGAILDALNKPGVARFLSKESEAVIAPPEGGAVAKK